MAGFRKKGNSWEAQVFKKGIRKSASFGSKREAQEWAATVEAEILAGVRNNIPVKPFGDLLDRYANEYSVKKKGARWEMVRIKRLKSDPISDVMLPDLDEVAVSSWRDRRLEQVSASSVRREWSLLSHACTVARRDWKWLGENPFMNVIKPKPTKARSRRPSNDEIERVLLALGYQEGGELKTISARVGVVWLFAIETAMRAGEIVGLTWEHVHLAKRYVHVADSKTGHSRDVPLSTEAVRLIEQSKGVDDELVFGLTSGQLDANFRKYRKKAMVEGLTFHDSRREALTRLSKKMDVLQLARISGHRDLRVLQNTYYSPDVGELVDLLD